MITVYDDAPEENNEYAEPQTCEGDGIRLYFRAVGEPWFESREIKIRLPLRDNLIFWSNVAGNGAELLMRKNAIAFVSD